MYVKERGKQKTISVLLSWQVKGETESEKCQKLCKQKRVRENCMFRFSEFFMNAVCKSWGEWHFIRKITEIRHITARSFLWYMLFYANGPNVLAFFTLQW